MVSILDKLPRGPVIFLGLFFAVMPIAPEPHLVQKALMLWSGVPLKPIDWFDVALHGGAGLLAVAKILRDRHLARMGRAAGEG